MSGAEESVVCAQLDGIFAACACGLVLGVLYDVCWLLRQHRCRAGSSNGGKKFQQRQPGGYAPRQAAKEAPASFEDKLKLFMQDSESRMADLRRNTDKKNGSRRRK